MERNPAVVLDRMRLFLCVIIVLLSTFVVIGPSSHSYAQGSTILFNIPEQAIESALDIYSTQADMSLIYKLEELKGITAHDVNGRYSPAQALQLLLKDTGLVFEQTTDKTISIKKADNLKPSQARADGMLAELATDGQPNAGGQGTAQPEGESHADFTLEDMIVTASMREIKAQSVPMSIQAVTGKNLEKRGAVGFEDFVTRIPGLTINVGSQGFNSLQIRGVSSISDGPTASATVGYYIDDTPISSAMQAPDAALFDLERIEVLKGPQGTLYGEGSLGGTVRLITRKPQMDGFEGKIQLIASDTENSPDFNFQTNAMINVPLVADKLAMRLAGSYADDAGFVDDANSGDEGTNSYRKSNIRMVFRFEPNERLTITPSFIYQKLDGGSPAYDSPLYPDLTWFRELPFNESYDDEYMLYALTLEYDLGWADLTSNTSYFDRDLTLLADGSLTNDFWLNAFLGPVFGLYSPYVRTDGESQTETFIQELRLVSTTEGPFSWVVGAFYRDRENNDLWHLPNEQLLQALGNETIFAFDVNQTAEQMAVFGDVNYDMLDNLILSVGARWFKEEIVGDSIYEQIFLNPTNPFELVSGRTQSELTEDDLLFKLALSYNPIKNLMLYTQFTQGRRPGGTNERSADFGFGLSVDPTFDSDSTDNYEVGIKSDWFNGKFRANAAYYYLNWQDVQVVDMGGLTGQSYVVNAAEACSTGFELELLAQPLYELSLGLSLNYSIEAEITKETQTGRGVIPEGAPLPWSPELSGSAFAEYALPIGNTLTGFAGADLQFMDDQFTDTQTGPAPPTELDAYHTVNLYAGVESDNWGLRLLFSNISDERADLDSYPHPAFGFIRNRPRTISLQYTANF